MSFGNAVATVFGGSGFIGRHLIRRLAKEGVRIRVPTRQPERVKSLMTNGAVGQIAPVPLNFKDDATLQAAVNGADIVINLIGILAQGRGGSFQTLQAELPGRIARAAAAADVQHFVQISAIGADGGSPSAYARTKAAGEQAVYRAMPNAITLRPSIVFGPEDDFFNRFAAMTLVSPALPLLGGGKSRFQPVYVGDVAAAIMAATKLPEAAGRTYELGGPAVYTFKELMQFVLRATAHRRLLLPVPWSLAMLQGKILEKLPGQLLTTDQVLLLRRDNIVSPSAHTLQNLGITPSAVEVIVPPYLERFRTGGRFSKTPSVV